MTGPRRRLFALALTLYGAAFVIAAVAGFINRVDEAPLLLAIGVCVVALGWWVRQSRGSG